MLSRILQYKGIERKLEHDIVEIDNGTVAKSYVKELLGSAFDFLDKNAA